MSFENQGFYAEESHTPEERMDSLRGLPLVYFDDELKRHGQELHSILDVAPREVTISFGSGRQHELPIPMAQAVYTITNALISPPGRAIRLVPLQQIASREQAASYFSFGERELYRHITKGDLQPMPDGNFAASDLQRAYRHQVDRQQEARDKIFRLSRGQTPKDGTESFNSKEPLDAELEKHAPEFSKLLRDAPPLPTAYERWSNLMTHGDLVEVINADDRETMNSLYLAMQRDNGGSDKSQWTLHAGERSWQLSSEVQTMLAYFVDKVGGPQQAAGVDFLRAQEEMFPGPAAGWLGITRRQIIDAMNRGEIKYFGQNVLLFEDLITWGRSRSELSREENPEQ